jgi:EF hand domain-containing protein
MKVRYITQVQCCIINVKDYLMKKTISFLILSSAMAFGAVTAYANHHEGVETEAKEMKVDVNNDGKVSYEEFKAAREKHMEEHFKRRDINGDGYIDEAEKKAARDGMKKHRKDCKKKMDDKSSAP